MATTTTAMTPLNPTLTIRRPAFGRSRPQIWEATSADGQWTYIRVETPGTPWVVRHNPTGLIASHAEASLPSARRATAADLIPIPSLA